MRMDGLLVIDKPPGITSHDVVARLRRILKTKRIGHTGTLDPFATGVLVMLIGKATRLARFLDKDEKEYEATIRFGSETDTGDLEGVRISDFGPRNEELAEMIANTDWDNLFKEFRGEFWQTPPMYSAKKREGKKLYELARKGEEVERDPLKVRILELERLESAIRNPQSEIRIRVVCSAGTYIRTLGQDIGRRIGTGAHLTELRRTRAGRFDISESISLDQWENLADPSLSVLPMGMAIEHLPKFVVSNDRIEKTRSGLSTETDEFFGD
ncbi:MAG: tRNA pseudouridine(55) synthase TruB, partial [Acidobacteria bacterium]|nr:tRNA pseudouridine(55) synthase TruB [Acidobacteriota bacterium]